MSDTLTYQDSPLARRLAQNRRRHVARPGPAVDRPAFGEESLDVDPLAGEDELWATEDILLAERISEMQNENAVAFFRTLAVAVAVGLFAWVVVCAVVFQASGLLPG